jgi:integrase
MQIERAADGTHKCWLREGEYESLVDAAGGWRDELILRLGGEVGLRSFEVPQIQPTHIRREVGDGFEAYLLRVPEGKDTRDGVGKPRDAYLPRRLETEMTRFAEERGLDDTDPFAPVTPRRIQQVVKEAAEVAANRTGDDDFRKVSSHDLRRYFAQTLLVRERMNPRVVMSVGGWSDFQAIEPYLNQPDVATIAKEFERAGIS